MHALYYKNIEFASAVNVNIIFCSGLLTDHGYVKCTLKEFNEYRQWIRKIKLDELHREMRLDQQKMEQAKNERLQKIAMERDAELLELMKWRYERTSGS